MSLSVAQVQAWLDDFGKLVEDNKDYLTDLDRQIGDSDHGTNMARGMKAVSEIDTSELASGAELAKKAGMALVSKVGGASGPLFGTFFLRFAGGLGDDGDVVAAFRAGVDGVKQRGKAEEGEKTMIDALEPAAAAMAATQGDLQEALDAGAAAAAAGRDATKDRIATKGRASYLGERSRGVIDPGAATSAYLVEAAARTLA